MATQYTNENPDEDRPGTLGDLLYAQRAQSGSEEDWVALVQAIAGGDQLALHALYQRTHRLVFTVTMRITTNRQIAEEVTLDVFHEVWRRAPTYDRAGGPVLGWILNQAHSRAIDRLRFEQRKKRVDPHADHGAEPTPAGGASEILELQEQSRLLRSALSVLTSEERQAIETAYFSELTYAEAAALLNQPLGTIKTRIRSGLEKLRLALAGQVNTP